MAQKKKRSLERAFRTIGSILTGSPSKVGQVSTYTLESAVGRMKSAPAEITVKKELLQRGERSAKVSSLMPKKRKKSFYRP